MSVQKFIDTALSAVRSNAELLLCNRLSLFNAIVKAARDGLMPDGREGMIVANRGVAEWRPMVYGLRKRFMELGGMLLDTQVVHVNDEFEYELGDSPFIRHRPPDVRKRQPRGEMCAVYCVVRSMKGSGGGEISYREVMDWEEISAIKGMIANKDSPLWTRHEKEAWKKSVVHRLAKTMPLVPEIAEIFERENEYVDWVEEEAAIRAEREDDSAANANPLKDPDIDLTDDDINQDNAAPDINQDAGPDAEVRQIAVKSGVAAA